MKKDFVPIAGFEGYYEVNSDGIIRTKERWVNNRGTLVLRRSIIKLPYDNGRGYLQVTLHRDNKNYKCYIHRLVYQAHIGDIPAAYEINHINGNRRDNRAKNLEALTKTDNLRDMIRRNPHVLDNLIRAKYQQK